jgi:hypothetical protein
VPFFKRHPFLCFALTGLLLLVLSPLLGLRPGLDGVRGVLFTLTALFCLPFSGVELAAMRLMGVRPTPFAGLCSIAVGLLLCFLLDKALLRLWRRPATGGWEPPNSP